MLDFIKKPLKKVLALAHQMQRQKELKASQPHLTRDQIASGLQAMGVVQGDMLFIHSSLKSLGYVEGGPKTVIEGLLDAVGPEGTLILPTYYMPGGSILGTCKLEGYVFDPRTHGTNMGALPEAFLQFEGVQRSIHPTHSVSAIGKHASHITESHHLAPSVFGKGSPWERFHGLNGKILGLGISMGPVTFYHLLEDTLGDRFPIQVWMDETYQMPCKGWQGEDFKVPVRPYKAELSPVRIDHKSRADLRDYMWKSVQSENWAASGKIGQADCWTLSSQPFYSHLEQLAKKGITVYSSLPDNSDKA